MEQDREARNKSMHKSVYFQQKCQELTMKWESVVFLLNGDATTRYICAEE
jgi:hypothetical protein